MADSPRRDVFGLKDGPPLHDPLAVAAILTGTPHEIPFYDFPEGADPSTRERFAIKVVTEGHLDDAKKGSQIGRTIATLQPPGVPGVRIARGLDVAKFWDVVEDCIQAADEANLKAGQ